MTRFTFRHGLAVLVACLIGSASAESHEEVRQKYEAAYAAAQQGKLADAEKLFMQTLESAQSLGESPVAIDAIKFNLANTYLQEGKVDQAVPIFEKVVKSYDEYGAKDGGSQTGKIYGYAASALGSIQAEQGKIASAEHFFNKAIAIGKASGGTPDAAGMRINLAHAYLICGQLEKSDTLLRQLINENQKPGPTENKGYYMRAEVLLGSCCLEEKQYKEAEEHTRTGLSLWKQMGGKSPLGEGKMLAILAESLRLQNKPDDAIELYKEALPLLREAHKNPESNDLSNGSSSKTELHKALEHYIAALKTANQDAAAAPLTEELEQLDKNVPDRAVK